MLSRLLEAEGRWVHALLVLSTFTVGLVLVGLVSGYLQFFSDVLLMLFIAWLFAFILSPVVGRILRTVPALPRAAVVVFVYGMLFVVLSAVVIVLAVSVAGNVKTFLDQLPMLQANLPETLRPWQEGLDSLGVNVVLIDVANDLFASLNTFLEDNPQFVDNVTGALGGVLGASVGIIGNLLMVVFMSLFIVVDKEHILGFVNRLVPPAWADEAKLFETSVASSFGGFLRGQVIQGLVYGAFAAAGSLLLGIDYWPLTTALVVILQIIPFFGPFLSWAPPVVAAILTEPDATLGILIVQIIGWFVTMNIVQPRVMSATVGIHPVMVLVSVIIGAKVYGVVGAIFAVPVAAVISAFFFHYLSRSASGTRDVASRAARRLEERGGRKVRVPTPPEVPSGAADLGAPGRLTGAPRATAQPPDLPA